jgi:hypothetical protein
MRIGIGAWPGGPEAGCVLERGCDWVAVLPLGARAAELPPPEPAHPASAMSRATPIKLQLRLAAARTAAKRRATRRRASIEHL